MKGGSKIWSTVVDYFLIIGAIVGVGFASGKEVYEFFFKYDGSSIFGMITFGLLYFYLFFIIQHVNNKLNLKTYSEFNTIILGRLCKISNIVMVINFSITSAGMLAAADYLLSTFFNVKFKIISLTLSIVAFIILVGGIEKVKIVANIIVPFMLAIIVINSIANINPENVNMQITQQNNVFAIYYGLLFGVNNFMAALPILFETRLKSRGKWLVIVTVCLIILFNILVLAGSSYVTDMPMFELSVNISKTFYYVYFAAMLLALFSTMVICTHNLRNIICKGKNSVFGLLMIMIFNLVLSNIGYGNIVKYLYVASGIISAIYVIVLVISILIKLINLKTEERRKNKKINKSVK